MASFVFDRSLANKAKVDGGVSNLFGSRPSLVKDQYETKKKYGINPGVNFKSLLEFKVWIKDYMVTIDPNIICSDSKMCYTVRCEEEDCSWIVCVRIFNGGSR